MRVWTRLHCRQGWLFVPGCCAASPCWVSTDWTQGDETMGKMEEGGWVGCLYKCIRSILSDGLRDERNGECGGTGLTYVTVPLKNRGGWQCNKRWWWTAAWRKGAHSRRGWAGSVWYVSPLRIKNIDSGCSLSQSQPCEESCSFNDGFSLIHSFRLLVFCETFIDALFHCYEPKSEFFYFCHDFPFCVYHLFYDY